ncbi:MAG: hypothetical protein RIQ72_467 [Candidatus Parcubacteria bacterium]|jgi:hypothetical protein
MKIFLIILSALILLIGGISISSMVSGSKTDNKIYKVIDWSGITPPWWMDRGELTTKSLEENKVEIFVEYNLTKGRGTKDMFAKWIKEDIKVTNALQTAIKKEGTEDGSMRYEVSPQMGADYAEMIINENAGTLAFKVIGTK